VSAIAIDQEREPSVLADFDTGHVLDELSSGIVVLDEQLCMIYANAIAEDLLAVHLPGIRGRPLPQLLPRPGRFVCAVRRALRRGATVDYTLRMGFERWPENADSINVRIAPLHNRMSGTYVLVEMSGRTWVRFGSSAPLAIAKG
jgi:nitrogen-specific signal transduction histidine kinase